MIFDLCITMRWQSHAQAIDGTDIFAFRYDTIASMPYRHEKLTDLLKVVQQILEIIIRIKKICLFHVSVVLGQRHDMALDNRLL
jgi:hypothetical protein